ncbi:MAG: CHASE2 domain-containing protein [Bacteroidetes bacterium]|nr:CHASE2 domain-containing protein [Bacteroidota bacterium]
MKLKRKYIDTDPMMSTILVFVTLVLLPLFLSFNFFLPLKNAFYDFAMTDINYAKLRSPEKELADTNIVLIDIGGMSNSELSDLLNILNQNEPRVIGIDKELRDDDDTAANNSLAKALSNVNRLVLSNRLIYNEDTKLFDSISESSGIFTKYGISGFTNQITIDDRSHETVRTFKIYTKVYAGADSQLARKETGSQLVLKDSIVHPFPVEVVLMFDPEKVQNLYSRNNAEEIINFRGYFNKYFFIAGEQVLNYEFNPNLFNGKILLLSYFDPFNTSPLFGYKYYSPLDSNYTGKSFPDMYGIEIHANVISMIINENYFNIIPSWLAIVLAFILCYLMIVAYKYIDGKYQTWYELLSLVIFVMVSLILLGANYYSYHLLMLDLNLNYALFAIILASPIYEAYTKSIKPLLLRIFKNKS